MVPSNTKLLKSSTLTSKGIKEPQVPAKQKWHLLYLWYMLEMIIRLDLLIMGVTETPFYPHYLQGLIQSISLSIHIYWKLVFVGNSNYKSVIFTYPLN